MRAICITPVRLVPMAAMAALAAALAVSAVPETASAQGLRADEFGPGVARGYVGVSVGQSKFDPDCPPGSRCSNSKTGFKVFAGTVHNETIGAEFGYINVGKIGYAGGSQKAHGFNLSLTGQIPFGYGFTGFGKIGGTYGWTETRSSLAGVRTGDDSGVGLSYGLGVGYRFSPALEAVLEYERHRFSFTPGNQTIGFTSIGLRFQY